MIEQQEVPAEGLARQGVFGLAVALEVLWAT
jgi:hypothetical protein